MQKIIKNILNNRNVPNYNINHKHSRAMTLIEVVIYCAIFSMFAITTIQMIIWLNFKLETLEGGSFKTSNDLFLLNFTSTYGRLKIHNSIIENSFKYLISSSSINSFNDYGVLINVIEGGKYKLFDSIEGIK